VAMKLSAAHLQHKSDIGALALDLTDDEAVRQAYLRLRDIPGHGDDDVLVEAMAPAGVELLVAAHRDGVVPALVVALGGIWVEVAPDAAVIVLPATPERVEQALRRLRAAAVLTGGRGRKPVDLAAASRLASAVGDLLLSEHLALIELNPVIVTPDGAIAADAVIRRSQPQPQAPAPAPAPS
jgi:succinyl-CoA synthetase beta subunit